MDSQLDLLLHPVRMRIVQTLMPELTLTVQEMEQQLDDIPPATLYRHVNKLKEAGILEIRHQEQIRGTVKNSYSLSQQLFQTPSADISTISDEENMKYFTAFTAYLQAEYQRYLSQPDKDFIRDGVSFRTASVFATDEEFEDWIREYRSVMAKLTGNKPGNKRRQRTISTIIIPGKGEGK
ncbi:helix-turn-helix domain-containing protein [Indiicoccus explosivorum]|uniref:helix-turn-helix domain-containing protein n=1 Tax=Indiicoccus explosivorum TaxID=1917864 RepID=UPI0013900B2F|nr:helix-turn-helix domain-containing protein [Indiicoccus explosivorum]